MSAPVIQPSNPSGGAPLAPGAGSAGANTTINPTETRVQQEAAAAQAAQQASAAYAKRERDVREYTDALVDYHGLPDEFRSTEAPDMTMLNRRGSEISSLRSPNGVDLAANARSAETQRFADWEQDQQFEGDKLHRARDYLYYQRERAAANTTGYFNAGLGKIEKDLIDVQQAYNEARLNGREFSWDGKTYTVDEIANLESSGMPDWKSSQWMKESRLANPTGGRAGILLDPTSSESQQKLEAEYQEYLKFRDTPLTFENKVYMPRVASGRIAADAAQNAARVEYNAAQNADLAGRIAMAESMGISLDTLSKLDASYRATAAAEAPFSPQTIDISGMDANTKHALMVDLGLKTFDELDALIESRNNQIIEAYNAGYSSPEAMQAAEKAAWTAYQNRSAAEQTNPVLRDYAQAVENSRVYDELGLPTGLTIPVTEHSLSLTTGALRNSILNELNKQNEVKNTANNLQISEYTKEQQAKDIVNRFPNAGNTLGAEILKGSLNDAKLTADTFLFTPEGKLSPAVSVYSPAGLFLSIASLGNADTWEKRIAQYNQYDNSGNERNLAALYTGINAASLLGGGAAASWAGSKLAPYITKLESVIPDAKAAAKAAAASAPVGTNPTIEAFTAGSSNLIKSVAVPAAKYTIPAAYVMGVAPSGIDSAYDIPIIEQLGKTGDTIGDMGKSIGYERGAAGIAGSIIGSYLSSLLNTPGYIAASGIGTVNLAKSQNPISEFQNNIINSGTDIVRTSASDPISAIGELMGISKGIHATAQAGSKGLRSAGMASGIVRGDIRYAPGLHTTGEGYLSAIYSGAIKPEYANTAARLETAPSVWIKTGFNTDEPGIIQYGISYTPEKAGNIGRNIRVGETSVFGESTGIWKDPITQQMSIDLSREGISRGRPIRPGAFAVNAPGESATLLSYLNSESQILRNDIREIVNAVFPGSGSLVADTRSVTVMPYQTRSYTPGSYKQVYDQLQSSGIKKINGRSSWDLTKEMGNPEIPYAVPTPKHYQWDPSVRSLAEKEIYLASDVSHFLPISGQQIIGITPEGLKIRRVYANDEIPRSILGRLGENIKRNTDIILNPAVIGRGVSPIVNRKITEYEAMEAAFRFAELVSNSRIGDRTNHGTSHVSAVNRNMQLLRELQPNKYRGVSEQTAELTAYLHDAAKNTSKEQFARGHGEVIGDIIRSGASLDPRTYLRKEAIKDFETTLGTEGTKRLNRMLEYYNSLTPKERSRIANAISQHSTNLGSHSGWVDPEYGVISPNNFLHRLIPPDPLSQLLSDSDRIDLKRFFPDNDAWRPMQSLMFTPAEVVTKVYERNYGIPKTPVKQKPSQYIEYYAGMPVKAANKIDSEYKPRSASISARIGGAIGYSGIEKSRGYPVGYTGKPTGYPVGYTGKPTSYPVGYTGKPTGYPVGYTGKPTGYPVGYTGKPTGYPVGYTGKPIDLINPPIKRRKKESEQEKYRKYRKIKPQNLDHTSILDPLQAINPKTKSYMTNTRTPKARGTLYEFNGIISPTPPAWATESPKKKPTKKTKTKNKPSKRKQTTHRHTQKTNKPTQKRR